jgi:putative SOS response-associated peptidase YedK
LTTDANDLMTEIHNTKKRMPVIVANENDWLNGQQLVMKNELLIAQKV